MDEQAVWAVVPGVSAVAAQLTWLEPAYVYLERVPRFPLTTQQKRDGIRLELYNPALVVDDWERGRIFDAQQELKWERRRAGMHVVYCGLHPPAGFQVVALNTVGTPVTTAYYLWGERVREEDLEKLGLRPERRCLWKGRYHASCTIQWQHQSRYKCWCGNFIRQMGDYVMFAGAD